MQVVKVLKRKDASSLILAVVIAMIVGQFVSFITADLSNRVTMWQWGSNSNAYGGYGGPSGSAKVMYLQPLVQLVLQLIALEIVVRLYILLHGMFSKKS